MTSSLNAKLFSVALLYLKECENHKVKESDWSDPKLCTPYELVKTMAEKRAWEIYNEA